MKIILKANKWNKKEKIKKSDAITIAHDLPWADRWTASSQAKDR